MDEYLSSVKVERARRVNRDGDATSWPLLLKMMLLMLWKWTVMEGCE
jgi:hypothetical protein